MHAVEFHLPTLPPSKNELRQRTFDGISRTKKYKSWRVNAGKEIMIQRVRHIKGPYRLRIFACRAERGQRDLGNILEATEDLLQWMRVIENDRKSEEIILRWETAVPNGVSIRVEPT